MYCNPETRALLNIVTRLGNAPGVPWHVNEAKQLEKACHCSQALGLSGCAVLAWFG